jgi:hypothetical protein
MSEQYRVMLCEGQRATLAQRIAVGKGPARDLAHARILLKADDGPNGPGWTGEAIAEAPDVGPSTVARVRKCFAEGGFAAVLIGRSPRRQHRRKLDGEHEARLIALACSPPPMGRRFWTLRLLADRMVELRFVGGLSQRPSGRC